VRPRPYVLPLTERYSESLTALKDDPYAWREDPSRIAIGQLQRCSYLLTQ
jgi:hypothetical protein